MPTLLNPETERIARAHRRWTEHVARWRNCQECPLCTQRDKIVLAKGVVPCNVLFLGEAPGMSEDVSGLPFDGPAGAKLDEIVAEARQTCRVQFTEAYTNVVCCFPAEAKQTKDHRPDSEYIKACSPRLQEFVEIADPKLIIAVGDTADDWGAVVCGAGQHVQWAKIVHPSAILRMPVVQRASATRNAAATIRYEVELTMLGEVPW